MLITSGLEKYVTLQYFTEKYLLQVINYQISLKKTLFLI